MKKIVKKSLILKIIMLKLIPMLASRIFIEKRRRLLLGKQLVLSFTEKKINRFGFLV